jgi:serine/threonine-protein kinase
MRARYHYAKRTQDDFNKAIEYFQRAVELDPNFALAYAMLSDLNTSMPAYPYMSPKEAFPKAKAAAIRALELDPNLSESHVAKGYVTGLYDWNWAEAERSFKRAVELEPNNALAHIRFSTGFYQPTGRAAESIKENETAVELEPLNLVAGANLTWAYTLAGRKQDAVSQGQRLAGLEPDFGLGIYQLGLAYINAGMYSEAISLAEKRLSTDGNDQYMLQVAGYAYARSGRADDARAMIARFREIARSEYVISFFIATIYAGLGDKDAAFSELEKAFQEHDWRMSAVIKVDPMIEILRDDPRYRDLLKRMNLAE